MVGRFWQDEERKAGRNLPSQMSNKVHSSSALFLNKGKDFQRIKRDGRRIQTPFFNLVFSEGTQLDARVGIVVGRRLGKAVLRNRVKRVFRELTRAIRRELVDGKEFLVFPKKPVLQNHYHVIGESWRTALFQAGLLGHKHS